MCSAPTHQADFSPANARRCCEGSLSRLQLDCIDVFTLRGPVPAGVPLEETVRELKMWWPVRLNAVICGGFLRGMMGCWWRADVGAQGGWAR